MLTLLFFTFRISHTKGHEGSLLAGYYLLAFLFGGNPLIVAWIGTFTEHQLLRDSIT